MANLSLSVSSEFGSTFQVDPVSEGECMSISIETRIAPDHVYARDWVTIHGTMADIRALIERMAAALPGAKGAL